MIRTLLEDRFKLAFHQDRKDTTVYALVGKPKPEFRATAEGEQTAFVPDRGRMTFRNMPISGLVNTLSNLLRTPVVDGTGITGFFDFTVDPMQFASPGVADTYPDLVITALREELGFSLEKRKAQLDFMVIDHAEKPSDN